MAAFVLAGPNVLAFFADCTEVPAEVLELVPPRGRVDKRPDNRKISPITAAMVLAARRERCA